MRLWKTIKRKSRSCSHKSSSPINQGQCGQPGAPRTISGQPIQRPLPDPRPYTSHPHITHYSRDLVISGPYTVCRCLLPTAHGDAFTRRHHASVANGISFLAPSGQPLTWEQAAHAFLDALGADSRVSPGWHMEDEALLREVYHEDTVRAIKRYHEVWEGVRRHGQLRSALEDDVYWWGVHNPRGVALGRMGKMVSGGAVVTVNGPFYRTGSDEGTGVEGDSGRGELERRLKERPVEGVVSGARPK